MDNQFKLESYKPLLVACTSAVITDELKKNIDEAGFDLLVNAPL